MKLSSFYRSPMLRRWAFLVALLAALPVLAQDPFGDVKSAPPAASPAQQTDAKAKAAAEAEPPLPIPLQLLRDTNPTTPKELLRAAEAAIRFERPAESKRYLAKLLASPPADEALVPIARQFADMIFRLSSQKEIQPEGKQAADLILAAAQRVAQDPDRINALLAKLSAEQPSDRSNALGQLGAAGAHVVTPMLRVLADPTRESEHRSIRSALVHLASTNEPPLIGALETPNSALKAQVVAVLGQLGSNRAAVHLVRPAVDPQAPEELRAVAAAALSRLTGAAPDLFEAQKYLAKQAAELLRGELPYPADHENQVELWHWDDAQQTVVARKLPKADAALLLATRVANDLYALKPGDNAAHRLMLLLNLELAKTLGGLDQPLPISDGTAGLAAVKSGPSVISQVLADAMKHGRVPAALAAIEVLSSIGDPSVLQTGAAESPLAQAITFPDRRVRLAAALAAVKLAPGASFPGAGRIGATLGLFAAASGNPSILVAHPRSGDAQALIGIATTLGYEGQMAPTGRALADRAFASADYDFILISDAIDRPPVEELVQWLRRDYRTARVPIGVMVGGEKISALRDLFADDKFTAVFPRLLSEEAVAMGFETLRAIADRNHIGRDEQNEHARSALDALATLAKNNETIASYDLLRQEPAVIHALNNPAVSSNAAPLLALFGTPKAQTALLDFASQPTNLLTNRQAAVAALSTAIKARGLLLTQRQIAEHYNRVNSSQSLDAPTQELLAATLAAIEAPTTNDQ